MWILFYQIILVAVFINGIDLLFVSYIPER